MTNSTFTTTTASMTTSTITYTTALCFPLRAYGLGARISLTCEQRWTNDRTATALRIYGVREEGEKVEVEVEVVEVMVVYWCT